MEMETLLLFHLTFSCPRHLTGYLTGKVERGINTLKMETKRNPCIYPKPQTGSCATAALQYGSAETLAQTLKVHSKASA